MMNSFKIENILPSRCQAAGALVFVLDFRAMLVVPKELDCIDAFISACMTILGEAVTWECLVFLMWSFYMFSPK